MRRILFSAAILLWSIEGFGWAEHHTLTRQALKNLPELQNLKVQTKSYEELLKSLGYVDNLAFLMKLTVHKDFVFATKLNEGSVSEVLASEVLSVYSDEPDWAMDMHLFDAGQYPELWKDEYAMMGGKKGTPSQAFRHMYWQSWSIVDPVATFKLPFNKLFSSMGEAPVRCQVYVNLARELMKRGQTYWALRFLGNALHYIEDVSSPFHANQTPTKKFMMMPFTDKKNGKGLENFVTQVTNIISYYHFAFEDYIGRLMLDLEKGVVNPETQAFAQALTSASRVPYQYTGDPVKLVQEVAELSVKQSSSAARASIAFFQPIPTAFDQFDPKAFMDDKWWRATLENGQADSEQKRAYFETVRAMFQPLGQWIRDFVKHELKNGRVTSSRTE